ncbi:serine dehydratase [Megasphaera cerevisiae DSM 20462]|jgi:L-serine dehydratase|uniref:L-serine dehydratase n=1 Tax=Megasphaera cerevisiae DSM 20462 TaxID=1122219 RepID=A0A0J6WQD0_9FIRM|nr:L-serine ammonia-lyase, iron-sulfur-dependent, subunit alpha [Megasphaera cerevisiae]KMO85610.1 serine dehydratase [Megasphaera cerevisiae DSM 20462]SKA12714.1 L-serine dehydratase [Megasphaera cerevisiae DSM 20462]
MYTYEYKTLHELVALAGKHHLSLSEIVVRHEMETSEQTEEKVRGVMASRLQVFHESIEAGLQDQGKSVSGLVGGDAYKMLQSPAKLLGSLSRKAAIYALAVSEANAKMFKIVACPTAGSCGIVPAVMTAVAEEIGTDQKVSVNALFTAAGIGAVVSRNASVAGAVGGCQAECGTAAAMAAAAAAEMAGGTNDEIINAFALCMKNTLGLACDPVAGLVEVPCVKRNACYAVMAVSAAEMALAGIRSVIPPDEVIEAMAEIGRIMPVALKETSDGGLARTATGKAIAARLEQDMQE